ncbi:hypothetical protein TNCT_17241 [Trichonephila clavata]|uniref:Uncharacterized protein n=1 Tax=Trichonephila clavata TaxID=2740835 RepID=A0A8X6H9V6_TRICU|nr:hypothetical protein TNCT_17241 [Trichonephila clavata]
MRVEKIMAGAIQGLQSNSEVRLDEGFNVEIITIRWPVDSSKDSRRVIIPAIETSREKNHTVRRSKRRFEYLLR